MTNGIPSDPSAGAGLVPRGSLRETPPAEAVGTRSSQAHGAIISIGTAFIVPYAAGGKDLVLTVAFR